MNYYYSDNNYIDDIPLDFNIPDNGDRAVFDKTETILYGRPSFKKDSKLLKTYKKNKKNNSKNIKESFVNIQNDTLNISIPLILIIILIAILYFTKITKF